MRSSESLRFSRFRVAARDTLSPLKEGVEPIIRDARQRFLKESEGTVAWELGHGGVTVSLEAPK